MRVEQLIGHDPDGDVRITLTYEQYKLVFELFMAGKLIGLLVSDEKEMYEDMYKVAVEYKHDEYC